MVTSVAVKGINTLSPLPALRTAMRFLLFISLILIFAPLMVRYTEKPLLLFLDDIIAFTFVRNCQATEEESAQNCICEGLPESAYIYFYEGNKVVEAKLRTEVPHSNKDLTSKYDFNYLGDGNSLKCVGVSMWQM